MAKILYGVAGQGFGHSTRSKEIINHLLSSGHEVKVVSYDKGYKNLSPFFDVEKIEGLGFVYQNNQVKYIKTFIENGKRLRNIFKSYNKVNKLVREYRPNIMFTDFEPICALAAKVNKIPLISIDNMHFITGTKIKYPPKYKRQALLTAAFISLIAKNARKYLVITFAKEKIIDKKVILFPPILRKEVLALQSVAGEYILVYLTSDFEEIVQYLKKINKKFIVYGLNRSGSEKNIIFKKPSQKGFLEDLRKCQGIIANAGFSLIGEALYLGKPYLAIPVNKQFEQIINAVYLEKSGYGMFCEKLNAQAIENFLSKISFYSANLKNYPKEDNSKIFTKIDELIKKYEIIRVKK